MYATQILPDMMSNKLNARTIIADSTRTLCDTVIRPTTICVSPRYWPVPTERNTWRPMRYVDSHRRHLGSMSTPPGLLSSCHERKLLSFRDIFHITDSISKPMRQRNWKNFFLFGEYFHKVFDIGSGLHYRNTHIHADKGVQHFL